MITTLAPIDLFAGAPTFYAPPAIGCSPDKPFLWRIPVTGTRPITLSQTGLPDGMRLDSVIPAIVGMAGAGSYEIHLTAENADGVYRTRLAPHTVQVIKTLRA